ncbi:hypothetical protein AJ87_31955 [Rhizobium yanglingense]|nr:hypothetical protein AJ87_31955 [Rhizobium yanglingense]
MAGFREMKLGVRQVGKGGLRPGAVKSGSLRPHVIRAGGVFALIQACQQGTAADWFCRLASWLVFDTTLQRTALKSL